MKTSELQGAALDWAVAKCEGVEVRLLNGGTEMMLRDGDFWYPSESWQQAGPIIEREQLNLSCLGNNKWEVWPNYGMNDTTYCKGPTPLIAAMRCYVARKLGEEVEVPHELA